MDSAPHPAPQALAAPTADLFALTAPDITPPKAKDAAAAHLDIDDFRDAAWDSLLAAPPWDRGVCFNPACRARFEPTRSWQIYCSEPCRKADSAALRNFGHKIALALVVWHDLRHETRDPAKKALCRAARRYVSQAAASMARARRPAPKGRAE